MSSVAANLRPLVSCPAFLFWHLLGAVICIPSVIHPLTSPDPGTGTYVAAFALPMWSALVLTSLHRDLLLRPFSFCLPGHREIQRRSLFLVGLATSFVASLTVLTYPGLGTFGLLSAVWSAFCFAMLSYLVVATSVFFVDNGLGTLGPFMVLGFAVAEFRGLRALVQQFALFSPAWNTILLGALSWYSWRRLGTARLARRMCQGQFLSLQRAWNRTAGEEYTAQRRRQSLGRGGWAMSGWLGRQLQARISRCPPLSLRRHLAAAQYEQAGRMSPASAADAVGMAVILLLVMICTGYASPREDRPEAPVANLAYLASIVIGMGASIPLFSTLLVPAGRRERFFAALWIGAGQAAVVLGISFGVYVALLGLGAVAPSFSLGSKMFSFRPADFELILFPLVVLPLGQIFNIVCRRWLLLPMILLVGSSALLLVRGTEALAQLSLPAVATSLAASWGLLVAVIWLYCFRGDLVRE